MLAALSACAVVDTIPLEEPHSLVQLSPGGVCNHWKSTAFHGAHQEQNSDRRERSMHIAILTFDGYNELDSLVAFGILNRVKRPDWRVSVACPTSYVRSMNGVMIESQLSLREASAVDAVIIGSGTRTREIVKDSSL